MKQLFLLLVLLMSFQACIDSDPTSRLNLNFDNTNYVVNADEDVTVIKGASLDIFADSDNFQLRIQVANYNGAGTYANDEIEFEVTFEGIEYSEKTTFKNLVILVDDGNLLSGNYDFRQPTVDNQSGVMAVGSFNIEL